MRHRRIFRDIWIFALSILILLISTFFLNTESVFSASAIAVENEGISPEMLNKWISALFRTQEDNRTGIGLPATFVKCATPLMWLAYEHPDWLETGNRFFLYRPDSKRLLTYYYPDSITDLYYDSPGGHFRIHYTESGNDAVYDSDAVESTIPDYVISCGSFFEIVWDYFENVLIYEMPPPDGDLGGNARFDVYLLTINTYGYTAFGNGHPYIVMHSSFAGFESNLDPVDSMTGNIKVTAAHEFFHAIQYLYDNSNYYSIWWKENTAVWAEDEIFNETDAYLNYLGNRFDDENGNLKYDNGETWYEFDGSEGTGERDADIWFEAPHISLDTFFNSIYTRYEYGGVMWAKYLSAKFSPDFIKECLIVAHENTDALSAVEETCINYGTTLEEEFFDFRVKVLTLDQDVYPEGGRYPLVRHYGSYGDYPVNITTSDMSHLASLYIGLAGPAGQKRLIVQIDGQDNSNFGAAVVLQHENGYDIKRIRIDDVSYQEGTIEIISFGTEGIYKNATIIPMNLSQNQNYREITINVSVQEMYRFPLTLESGINLIGLIPDNDQRSTSFWFLQRYFTNQDMIQFSAFNSLDSNWSISYMLNNIIHGSDFNIDWHMGYLLTVPHAVEVELIGGKPFDITVELSAGDNLISSLISEKNYLYSSNLWERCFPDKTGCRGIKKYENGSGKWEVNYLFFGQRAGPDFRIERGEGFMVNVSEPMSVNF